LPKPGLNPYWSYPYRGADLCRLYRGDAAAVLARLPERSVQCVVTSPPYWGLRDYRAGDRELGREYTPGEYAARLVDVFRGVRRVLRDDGTVWLNLGDTFGPRPGHKHPGLVNVPHRVLFALKDDGWVHAMEHVWAKPDPMPESVRNRCTRAHEYVFLLAKSARYYYDNEAIKEAGMQTPQRRFTSTYKTPPERIGERGTHAVRGERAADGADARNKRSVWTLSSGGGYAGAHFATFPRALVEPCVLAGTSARGCCAGCGAPHRRRVEGERVPTRPGKVSKVYEPGNNKQDTGDDRRLRGFNARWREGHVVGNRDPGRHVTTTRTVGWEPTCPCGDGGAVRPCVVLDPFVGSGTTCLVAVDLGRAGWGIELSEEYLRDHCVPRCYAAAEAWEGRQRAGDRRDRPPSLFT
jgi:DNA modification methylase